MDKNTEENGIVPFDPEPSCPRVTGSKRNKFYFMQQPKRGKCLIFSQKSVKNSSMNIPQKDISSLTKVFEYLQLEVFKYENFTLKEIGETLYEVSKEDHRNSSCFICCFLTYGDQKHLYSEDDTFSILSMLEYFRCDMCLSLAGKPKIFITQAYQIEETNPGKNLKPNYNSKESTDSGESPKKSIFRPKTERIPLFSDFLIVNSTLSRLYTFKNGEQSSLFIQLLCHALFENSENKDFISILTMVNNALVHSFRQQTIENGESLFFESSLTKDIRFPKL